MDTTELLSMILLGGLLGAVGQGIRVCIGLKKAMQEAPEDRKSVAQLFEIRTLTVGLLIGFIAGALAIVALNAGTIGAEASAATVSWTYERLLGLIAAGYSGTDFIEGIVKKRLPLGGKPASAAS